MAGRGDSGRGRKRGRATKAQMAERQRWDLAQLLDRLERRGRLTDRDQLQCALLVARELLDYQDEPGGGLSAGLIITDAGKAEIAWYREQMAEARKAIDAG